MKLLIAAILIATSTQAYAAPICGPRDKITSTLSKNYGETSTHRGLTPKGTMLEIFASKNKTFSVVITTPSGKSCLVAGGTHWERATAVVRKPKEGKMF